MTRLNLSGDPLKKFREAAEENRSPYGSFESEVEWLNPHKSSRILHGSCFWSTDLKAAMRF
jgi:hypothetical protein